MRILSLFFVPALALTYFAGTQHVHGWSFALLGGAGAFLYFLIAQFYKMAFDAPVGLDGLHTSELTAKTLKNYLGVFTGLEDDTPVYVAVHKPGIVVAHDVYVARYDGRHVLIVGSDDNEDGTDVAE